MVQPNNQFYLILLLLLVAHYYGTDAKSPIPPPPTSHNKMWDPSMAIIVISLIGIFFSVGLFSLYLSRCISSYYSPYSSQRGIHPQLLHSFPTLFFSTINHLRLTKGTLECAVCLNDFTDNDMLRLLPQCNHVFHPPCIDQWLSSHVTCPLCRADLTQDFHQVPILVPTQISVNETRIELEGSRSGAGEIEVARGKGGASKWKVLRRANSTGHSVVESGECMERYTLRLPEEVRKYILLNHGVMQRSNSYNVVMTRRGGLCWSDSEGSSGKSSKRNNIGTRL